MKIVCDPVKDQSNRAKHGISLLMAEEMDWEWALIKEDDRQKYGELRMIGYAPAGSRLYCVVYVDRGDERRIISLRKANSREVNRYVQATQN